MKTLLLLLLAVAPAAAQKFVLVGAPDAACQQALHNYTVAVSHYPHPVDWTYYVVCDAERWMRVANPLAAANHTGPMSLLGLTNIGQRMTAIRADALRNEVPGFTAEHVVAHELAHVYLHTTDDDPVERLATRWVTGKGGY